jgi:hypothetical protein
MTSREQSKSARWRIKGVTEGSATKQKAKTSDQASKGDQGEGIQSGSCMRIAFVDGMERGDGGGGKSRRVEVVDVERGNVVWSWLLFRYYPVSRIPLMDYGIG